MFIFFLVSSIEEDPLYIAYADMMAKVLHSHSQNCFHLRAYCTAKYVFDTLLCLSELC